SHGPLGREARPAGRSRGARAGVGHHRDRGAARVAPRLEVLSVLGLEKDACASGSGSMARAPFISLDGLDGSGKSTQCRLLAEWLRTRGLAVTDGTDPGGTPVGNVIRALLLDRGRAMSLACEALLFMASRAQLTAEVIRPALDAGRAVVADRFLLANIVYQ